MKEQELMTKMEERIAQLYADYAKMVHLYHDVYGWTYDKAISTACELILSIKVSEKNLDK